MPSVLIETYGCTLNQADSDIMESLLKQGGIGVTRVSHGSEPKGNDFVIVNTCTVKKATEQRIRERLRAMAHLGSRLVVTGCMAGANRDIIEETAPDASIVSPGNITGICQILAEIGEKGKVVYDKDGRTDKSYYIPASNSAISRIPVSEGCLSSCDFCETRFARSPLNSFSEELILHAIAMNVKNGAKEIELTSQDMGAYGADRKTNIANLLEKAVQIEGEFRIRVGMMNPEHLHRYFDELVESYGNEKMYKFIHLPVQSGSNKVLREMERRYTIEQFSDYLKELRSKVPGICIETDIIVGYPTETEEDFLETVEMVNGLRPTITNISKFGLRPHTAAAKLRQLPGPVVKDRSIRLARMVKKMQQEDFARYLGRRVRVLFTEANGSSITGRTDSYIPVAVNNLDKGSIGKWVWVDISGNSYACIIGKAIGSKLQPVEIRA